jgi:hypothetical protein
MCLDRYYRSAAVDGVVQDDGNMCDTQIKTRQTEWFLPESKGGKFAKISLKDGKEHVTNLMPTKDGAYCGLDTFVQEPDGVDDTIALYDASKVPCRLRYGVVQWGRANTKRMAKGLPRVEDAVVFCAERDGRCGASMYIRGCGAQREIGAGIVDVTIETNLCSTMVSRGFDLASINMVDLCTSNATEVLPTRPGLLNV